MNLLSRKFYKGFGTSGPLVIKIVTSYGRVEYMRKERGIFKSDALLLGYGENILFTY